MASVLHGSARPTPRIRAELQASKESARALAARYGLNAKTARKWRKRTTTADEPKRDTERAEAERLRAEEKHVVSIGWGDPEGGKIIEHGASPEPSNKD